MTCLEIFNIVVNSLPSLFALLLVIATFMYFLQTKKLVEENKKFRNEQYRPRVAVGYEILRKTEAGKRKFVYFVVRNVGLLPAFNIRFEIESDLAYSKERKISQIYSITNLIRYLMPNQDSMEYLFNVESPYEERYKSTCNGTLIYNDALGKEYRDKFTIDFKHAKPYIYFP